MKAEAVKLRPDFTWLHHPAVIIVVGEKGGGKSATSHYILEMYHNRGLTTYMACAPRKLYKLKESGGLPDWLILTGRQMSPDAVVIIDDAQLQFHAKEHYRSIGLHKVITMSRHKQTTIIFTTQQTRSVTKDIVAESDTLILKRPSLFAEYTEREFIGQIIKRGHVNQQFDAIAADPLMDERAYSYVVSNKPRYVGMVGPTSLPSYWSKELGDW